MSDSSSDGDAGQCWPIPKPSPGKDKLHAQGAGAVQQEGAAVSCSLCSLLFSLKCEAEKREIGRAKVWLESFKCPHVLVASEEVSLPLSNK